MHVNELIKYVRNPGLLARESIPELQKLVQDFPYFQTGHLLLSLAAKKWDSAVYQQCIKKTAIVVNNREHLYKLIHNAYAELETAQEKELTENPKEELVANSVTTEKKSITASEKKEDGDNLKIEAGKEAINEKALEEQVEREIEKAVVNAFVEKEVLHTNEVFKIERKPEAGSFSDWLQFLKKNNGQPYHEIAAKVEEGKQKRGVKQDASASLTTNEEKALSEKQKKKALIDKIIEANPGAIRTKDDQKFFKSDQRAKESLLENEHLVTETLAQIYALQGQTSKAIRAYEILSLKYPHKSSYYAGLIARLKEENS